MSNIREIRLRNEYQRLARLASESSRLGIVAVHGDPADIYLLHFDLVGLVQTPDGRITEHRGFLVQISCPTDYPREGPLLLVRSPETIWHPNVLATPPHLICLSRWAPSMWLDDIAYRTADLLSYRSYTLNESDSLNKPACRYIRQRQNITPTDTASIFPDRRIIITEVE